MSKQDLDTPLERLLNNVDYATLNSDGYVPSAFALEFINFFKYLGVDENPSPAFHYKMLDNLVNPDDEQVANLCFRGSGKTTLLAIKLTFWIIIKGELPGLPDLDSMIYVSDTMDNGVANYRKNLKTMYEGNPMLQTLIPKLDITENYISAVNEKGKKFAAKLFGIVGSIRGTQINNKRPSLIIMDDLFSDKSADSLISRRRIRENVYGTLFPAAHPTKKKYILLGTPFTYDDIIVTAVESGSWKVSVWPVCEKFPVSEEEFNGAWESRFTYKSVEKYYTTCKTNGSEAMFYRESMLRLGAVDAVLVPLEELHMYEDEELDGQDLNYMITTDFAYTDKESSDDSVISVWAIGQDLTIYWVDGICEKQTMDKNMEDLLRLCEEYNPISVGIETSGQQGAVVAWFKKEMQRTGRWYSMASNRPSGEPGIFPSKSKLSRFTELVPSLLSGKVKIPSWWGSKAILREAIKQITSVTPLGIVTADDVMDTFSMLNYMKPWAKGDPMYKDTVKDTIVNADPLWEVPKVQTHKVFTSRLGRYQA